MILNCVFLFVIIYCTEIVQPRQSCTLPEEPNYDLYDSISERHCQNYLWEMRRREVNNGCRHKWGVIEGEETDISKYPHMGAVGWPSRSTDTWIFLCGSFLISDRFALTAAHCTKTTNADVRNKTPQIIRFGATNIVSSPIQVPMDINISDIITHPYYNSPLPYYDIALFKLKEKVSFSDTIQPACLSNKPTVDTHGESLTVTGWGETEDKKNSPTLMFANIDLLDSEVCNKKINKNRKWQGMRNHQLCAGSVNGKQDTCRGDSGGPLQFKLNESYSEGVIHRVVGIASFGNSRCGNVGVYIKISSFIRWIEENVWQTNDGPDNSSVYSVPVQRKRENTGSRIIFPDQENPPDSLHEPESFTQVPVQTKSHDCESCIKFPDTNNPNESELSHKQLLTKIDDSEQPIEFPDK